MMWIWELFISLSLFFFFVCSDFIKLHLSHHQYIFFFYYFLHIYNFTALVNKLNSHPEKALFLSALFHLLHYSQRGQCSRFSEDVFLYGFFVNELFKQRLRRHEASFKRALWVICPGLMTTAVFRRSRHTRGAKGSGARQQVCLFCCCTV